MTDLDKIKLCAEAMGYTTIVQADYNPNFASFPVTWVSNNQERKNEVLYDPFHDDAQAMALVKKLKLHIYWDREYEGWIVGPVGLAIAANDLNCAIVECVAKMRAAR